MGKEKESKVSLVSTKAPQDSYVVRGGRRFNLIMGLSQVC